MQLHVTVFSVLVPPSVCTSYVLRPTCPWYQQHLTRTNQFLYDQVVFSTPAHVAAKYKYSSKPYYTVLEYCTIPYDSYYCYTGQNRILQPMWCINKEPNTTLFRCGNWTKCADSKLHLQHIRPKYDKLPLWNMKFDPPKALLLSIFTCNYCKHVPYLICSMSP